MEALKELELATALQPENLRFTYVYIVALSDLGKKQEARTFLDSAQKRFPDSGESARLKELW